MNMATIAVGDKAVGFTFQTPWEKNRDFFAETRGRKSILFFLRYYGCTTCQLEIHNLIANHSRFVAAGASVYVVLQSGPATITENVSQGDIPFVLILDPEQKLYAAYGIGSREEGKEYTAAHQEKKKRAIAQGFSHGKFEGNEQQLPAVFVLDEDHTVVFAHYGEEVSDIPEHDRLLEILRAL
jgi:peroxiredoxin